MMRFIRRCNKLHLNLDKQKYFAQSVRLLSTLNCSRTATKFNLHQHSSSRKNGTNSTQQLPTEADVVVIGGGSIGCSTTYHLAKYGAGKVALLEKDKLTAGTTWHTAGLLWRAVPHEFEMKIVDDTRTLMTTILPQETDSETGWIQTGGLFTANDQTRLDSYKRMATLAKVFGIETHILSAAEIPQVHHLLDSSKYVGALYNPLDGTMDPTGACTSYTKAAAKYGAQIFEGCGVEGIDTRLDDFGIQRVSAVKTSRGSIKTGQVINCAGVWAPNISQMVHIAIPQVTYRHAYVVTEPIEGARHLPNVRDHDGSVYMKRQGDTLQVGGYEANPIFCKEVADDFAFGLYTLDWDVFGRHLAIACDAMPIIAKTGIRSTICGPESFTPDKQPLCGESPKVRGFFFASGFNSGGMMLGGGGGKQIALWALRGKPEIDMFPWDIRRFPSSLVTNKTWLTERSHETYSKHYCMSFPHDQPLAGRNMRKDALHQVLLDRGCFYEEKHGWERPAYFTDGPKAEVKKYDFYGAYDNKIHQDYQYKTLLNHEYSYRYPGPVHEAISKECVTCRTSCAVFNSSSLGKLVLEGPDATKAAKLLFSSDVTANPNCNTSTYTLMLNDKGGIESDLVVCKMDTGDHDFDYYMTVGGATTEYCKGHISDVLSTSGLNYNVKDRTEELATLSLQGPKSRAVLKELITGDVTKSLQFGHFALSNIVGINVGILRRSFVGELGYEVSCESQHAVKVYEAIMGVAKKHGGRDAGYRAMESLSIEAGFHHWGHSVRTDDSPLESRLLHLCNNDRHYHGSAAVAEMRGQRPKKSLAFFTVDDQVQLFGEEIIWRDGKVVGFTRNGVHAFNINKGVGMGYVDIPENDKSNVDDYLLGGKYEIERNFVKHRANVYLNSPFDPKRLRVRGLFKST
uniref:Sarcosine dehydrogenase, mitochondrial-like n=1 Tax=Phallusia mammillata TaxID=59560 RepID=A0A6F9DSJ6_9ASCI|nr:sarcosine dehydrogenase, mitochondrial-like [Phallusia mammillata]